MLMEPENEFVYFYKANGTVFRRFTASFNESSLIIAHLYYNTQTSCIGAPCTTNNFMYGSGYAFNSASKAYAVYFKIYMPYFNDLKSSTLSFSNSTSPATLQNNTLNVTDVTSSISLVSVTPTTSFNNLSPTSFSINELTDYNFDSDYLIFKSNTTLYCNINKASTFALSSEICKISGTEDFEYIIDGTTVSWLSLNTDGTGSCSPTELLSSSYVQQYIIRTASSTPLELMENNITVSTYD